MAQAGSAGNRDWQDTQNESYLNLLRSRLNEPRLRWVEQFVQIINANAHRLGTAGAHGGRVSLNEFGCNVGHFYRGVESLAFPVEYRGYDISETYLAIARQAFGAHLFHNLDVACEGGTQVPENCDISVISATLEHIENYQAALRNIFTSTGQLVVIRTLVGADSRSDYCRTSGATADYLIRQFTLDELVAYPAGLGWQYEEQEDAATRGEIKHVCNGTSIPRSQRVLIFGKAK